MHQQFRRHWWPKPGLRVRAHARFLAVVEGQRTEPGGDIGQSALLGGFQTTTNLCDFGVCPQFVGEGERVRPNQSGRKYLFERRVPRHHRRPLAMVSGRCHRFHRVHLETTFFLFILFGSILFFKNMNKHDFALYSVIYHTLDFFVK